MTQEHHIDIHGACPNCGMTWGYECSALPEGTTQRFSYLIGVVDPDLDRVVHWQCPTCNKEFPR